MIDKNIIKSEFSKIALKDWIIMILLAVVLYQLMFTSKDVVKLDNTELLATIKSTKKEVDGLKKQLVTSTEKINTIEKLILINSKNTIAIQNKLKDEKEKLDDLSDDDNVHYFHNYIVNYRLQSK